MKFTGWFYFVWLTSREFPKFNLIFKTETLRGYTIKVINVENALEINFVYNRETS